MYRIVERNIVIVRGPHWWLAWMSHAPETAFKGRSREEAVGRLICGQRDSIGFGIPIVHPNGFPAALFAEALTPTSLALHRQDVARYRVDRGYIPVAGKDAA